MVRELLYRIPGFDDWVIIPVGLICAIIVLAITAAIVARIARRFPMPACALACLPGFVLQSAAGIYLLRECIPPPSAGWGGVDRIDLMFLYLLTNGYAINWLPFVDFICAGGLMILEALPGSRSSPERYQVKSLLVLTLLCGAVLVEQYQFIPFNWGGILSLVGPAFYVSTIGICVATVFAIYKWPSFAALALTIQLLTVISLSYVATLSRINYMN